MTYARFLYFLDLTEKSIFLLIVTKGENGASTFYKKKERIEYTVEVCINVNSINTVGCSDIFGALFFYSYIKTKDFGVSLKAANIAAGVSTTYNSISEFKNLKRDAIQRIN